VLGEFYNKLYLGLVVCLCVGGGLMKTQEIRLTGLGFLLPASKGREVEETVLFKNFDLLVGDNIISFEAEHKKVEKNSNEFEYLKTQWDNKEIIQITLKTKTDKPIRLVSSLNPVFTEVSEKIE